MTETPTFKTMKRLAAYGGLLCCLLLAVVACGQRGPLYLPEQNTGAMDKQQATGKEETVDKKDTEEDGSENEETP